MKDQTLISSFNWYALKGYLIRFISRMNSTKFGVLLLIIPFAEYLYVGLESSTINTNLVFSHIPLVILVLFITSLITVFLTSKEAILNPIRFMKYLPNLYIMLYLLQNNLQIAAVSFAIWSFVDVCRSNMYEGTKLWLFITGLSCFFIPFF